MVSSTAQNFSAALKKIVKSMPYGSQTALSANRTFRKVNQKAKA